MTRDQTPETENTTSSQLLRAGQWYWDSRTIVPRGCNRQCLHSPNPVSTKAHAIMTGRTAAHDDIIIRLPGLPVPLGNNVAGLGNEGRGERRRAAVDDL